MTTSTSTATDTFVLYVDHQDHPAPLTECFHATASRRLSSTVDRHGRPSTITQVDSAYCPQCLSFHDASSAATLGYCSNCVSCPLCCSVVSCAPLDSENKTLLGFVCGQCDWTSQSSGLTVPFITGGTKEDVAQSVDKLTESLNELRQAATTTAALEHYQHLIAGYEGLVKKPFLTSKKGSKHQLFQSRNEKEDGAWSVEALESALQEKAAKNIYSNNNLFENVTVQYLDLTNPPKVLEKQFQDAPVRVLTCHNATNLLLPQPIPLKSRKSRRCRAELAEGKPGILVKPKLNPLEGDSSLRTGHGQWWKKDSSAFHVIPKVRVVQHAFQQLSEGDKNRQQAHAFLIKITNPTLGLVRLQLAVSEYQGEERYAWNGHDETQPKKNPLMNHLLVDTLSNRYADVLLLTPSNDDSSISVSDVAELESAEDAIVDFGKVRRVPDVVGNWDGQDVLSKAAFSDIATEANVSFTAPPKLLAQQSSVAWFEVLCACTAPSESRVLPAIPLALRIEVGNGSWESSLIKAKEMKGEAPDISSFDIVLTWQQEK